MFPSQIYLVNQGIYFVDSINGVFLPCQFDLVVRCFFELLLRVLSLFLMLAPRSTNWIDIQVGGFHHHRLLFERLDDNISRLLVLHLD